jgi:hypothetical protein
VYGSYIIFSVCCVVLCYVMLCGMYCVLLHRDFGFKINLGSSMLYKGELQCEIMVHLLMWKRDPKGKFLIMF